MKKYLLIFLCIFMSLMTKAQPTEANITVIFTGGTMNSYTADFSEKACSTTDPVTLQADCVGCTGGETYQWQAFNTFINDFENVPASLGMSTFSGMATANLVINVGADLNYDFRVIITEGGTPPNPTVGNLSYLANPSAVSISTGPITFCANDNVPLTSSVTGGTAVQYDWKKGGVSTGGTLATYVPSGDWTTSEAGNYTLEVKSDGCLTGLLSSTTVVNVNEQLFPTITANSSTDLCVGEELNLTASPGADSYQWSLNGSVINGAAAQLQTLVIDPVAIAQAGSYTVTAGVTGCADGFSNVTTVSVSDDVMIAQTDFDNETIGQLGTATFIVSLSNFDGTASTGIVWDFGGANYTEGGGTQTVDINGNMWQVSVSNSGSNPNITSTLTVTDVQADGPNDNIAVGVSATNNTNCASTATGATVSISGAAVLPVELISFEGKSANDAILLNWVTASEINNAYFTVERSLNGKDFSAVGEIAGAGTTEETQEYNFRDVKVTEGNIFFYRLIQTDFDGASTHSEVISVRTKGNGDLAVVNVTSESNGVVATLDSANDTQVTLSIFDAAGRMIQTQTTGLAAGQNRIEIILEESISGIYFLNIQSTQTNVTKKFVR